MTDGRPVREHNHDHSHGHDKKFGSFAEFYEFYLDEHSEPMNRRLHFAGCVLVIAVILCTVLFREWLLLLLVPVFGYGLAWAGHFFIEKNKPATFKYPLWSLMGDWAMFAGVLSGKIKL